MSLDLSGHDTFLLTAEHTKLLELFCPEYYDFDKLACLYTQLLMRLDPKLHVPTTNFAHIRPGT